MVKLKAQLLDVVEDDTDAAESQREPLPRLLYSLDDVVAMTGIPRSTLDLLRKEGKSPRFIRLGRRLFTTPALLAEWVERLERTAEPL